MVFPVVTRMIKCTADYVIALAAQTQTALQTGIGGDLMVRIRIMAVLVVVLLCPATAPARDRIHITHAYANTNAQSLIGLPMGDHKTIVDMEGNLHWSQWSLKRRALDVPFGFSAQMDGTLAIQILSGRSPLKVTGQHLYRNRFPFVVTYLAGNGFEADELAFSTEAASHGLDVVRVLLKNTGPSSTTVEVRLSGKRHNLPALADKSALTTRDGYLVALAQAQSGTFSAKQQNFLLDYRTRVPAHSTVTLWLKRPYSLLAKDSAAIAVVSGSDLLNWSIQSWEAFWAAGANIELPEGEIKDFYDSSLAYVVILTERGPEGDLWTLDGPGVYRQYWGRGEYFQARALEVSGHMEIAKATAAHAFKLQYDDGEWDRPAISGWPAWDSIGGEGGTVWDYYLFSHDRAWLAKAYPYTYAAARWIEYHREESELPADAPAGAQGIQRQLPWSCREEPNPPLKLGEKPYWWGLLPWGYGDSGLPQGHAFTHNVMALYEIECALKAALELGRSADAERLRSEYTDFKAAILDSMQRAIALEKEEPHYLPAMPTLPDGAISQSFLAVYPTQLFSPEHPWVTGLLQRMERTEVHGQPANMAWMGAGGVWPGESMNVAETYLRRGQVQKAVDMLISALNFSYTTNVWREEIRVNKDLPPVCDTTPEKRATFRNGHGTGDMPEAWANANLVNLVRDMLLYRRDHTLYLLAGIPADWISPGEYIGIQNAPVTFGGKVSFRLTYPRPGEMVLTLTPPPKPIDISARFPISEGQSIKSAKVSGKQVKTFSGSHVFLQQVAIPVSIKVEFR
jgi:hypothetical protein